MVRGACECVCRQVVVRVCVQVHMQEGCASVRVSAHAGKREESHVLSEVHVSVQAECMCRLAHADSHMQSSNRDRS